MPNAAMSLSIERELERRPLARDELGLSPAAGPGHRGRAPGGGGPWRGRAALAAGAALAVLLLGAWTRPGPPDLGGGRSSAALHALYEHPAAAASAGGPGVVNAPDQALATTESEASPGARSEQRSEPACHAPRKSRPAGRATPRPLPADVTKFVVIAHQRSGSTYVIDHLNQRLFGYGGTLTPTEPFSPGALAKDGWAAEDVAALYVGEDEAAWGLFRRRLDEVFAEVNREFADAWGREPGYAAGAIRPRAVGFKLMKNQVSKANYLRFLEWAGSEAAGRVKVVHLLRANTIEEMLSLVSSRATGTFHARDEATVEEARARAAEQEDEVKAELLQVYKDPRAIANKFDNLHCWTNWFMEANDRALGKSAHMQVVYETLTDEATKRSAFDALLEFLGLDSAEATGAECVFGVRNPHLRDLKRIHGVRPPRDRVINWEDWEAALNGTLALQIAEDPARSDKLTPRRVAASKRVFAGGSGEEACTDKIDGCAVPLCADRQFREGGTVKWEPPAAVTEADLEVADAGAEGATKGGKEEASETEEAPASPDP